MGEPDTDTLRKLAPCWTLAGDERLLTLLQNTHQRLLTKCQETNAQLEKMVTSLDDASISLQNVNNQFMSLSSSQFIERRVYDDDDTDVAMEAPAVQEQPKLSIPDDLAMLRRSIAVLDNTHEVITILSDSDTESDSDGEATSRLVMRPRDVYGDRPLPYIIGSEPWKSKWHAGLMVEDSDTDSSTSKVDRESDQYSQSEPEDFELMPSQHARKLSSSSSEVQSEAPAAQSTAADVARDLARRLGAGEPAKVIPREEDDGVPTKSSVKAVYKPEQPVSSTIFPDEPPPLDQSDSETDIFAELHRNQPYKQPYSRQQVSDELFGDNRADNDSEGDIFSDFANQPPAPKPVSLFDAGPTPHMFDKQLQANDQARRRQENLDNEQVTSPGDDGERSKKPVGGISLFGSNSGTANIGAAILKRNQRKSISSEESGSDSQTHTSTVKDQQIKKEKDIFDDLFARSETKKTHNDKNKIKKEIIPKEKVVAVKKDTPKAVDLFSDNLFDDIDDIFTTNVVKSSKDKNKSIFDDNDDLFTDITETKTVKATSEKKGLFDDGDDDLFTDNIPKQNTISNKSQDIAKTSTISDKFSEQSKQTAVDRKVNDEAATSREITPKQVKTSIFIDEDDNLFTNTKDRETSKETKYTVTNIKPVDTNKNIFNSPLLFDDDDDSNLFVDNREKKTDQGFDETLSSHDKNTKDSTDIDIHVAKVENTKTLTSESNAEGDTAYKNKLINDVETPKNVVTSNYINQEIDSHDNLSKNLQIHLNIAHKDIAANTTTRNEDLQNKNKESPATEAFVKASSLDLEKTIPSQHLIQNITISNSNLDSIQNTGEKVKNYSKDIDKKLPDTTPLSDEDCSIQNVLNATPAAPSSEPSKKSDIFSDLISEPPDFEKPKEPKKSKNVNALFDDDSDDETLFFKRDDITDEKPEDFTAKQDRLFDIFVNEPPDEDFNEAGSNSEDDLFNSLPKPKLPSEKIPGNTDGSNLEDNVYVTKDISNEFTSGEPNTPSTSKAFQEIKHNKNDMYITNTKLNKSVRYADSIYDDTNSMLTQPESLMSTLSEKVLSDDDDDLFKSLPVRNTEPESISRFRGTDYKSDEELFKSLPPNLNKVKLPKPVLNRSENIKLPTESGSTESISRSESFDIKKVNKLKVGLNINVNALLPGASPKKVKVTDNNEGQVQKDVPKVVDSIDGQAQSLNQKDVLPPKTINLDEEHESKVLDNKLSKERPRIQVKRRPSSRRARKEAVRKSAIDFGEDSTDNSSSFDDPSKSQNDIIKTDDNIDNTIEHLPEDVNVNKELSHEIDLSPQSMNEPPSLTNNEEKIITDKSEANSLRPQKEVKPTNNKEKELITEKTVANPMRPEIEVKPDVQIKTDATRSPVKSDSTTKIVYILTDEDIFNTTNIENTDNKETSTKLNEDKTKHEGSSNTVKAEVTRSDLNEPIIKTLGNTYKSDIKGDDTKSKSLFGEDEHSDDEEMFKSKKTANKTVIFDSDSEEDLFGSSKKEKKVDKVMKVVKGSLFGDDDDGDDLFGVKTTKRTVSMDPQSSTKFTSSVKEPSKPRETVFEDPLSLFGEEG